MFGAPGETPDTILETISVIDNFQIPQGVWITIGICLWTSHKKILEDAYADGQYNDNKELFSGANYVSPHLSRKFMIKLVETSRKKDNYTVQVNKLYADYKR